LPLPFIKSQDFETEKLQPFVFLKIVYLFDNIGSVWLCDFDYGAKKVSILQVTHKFYAKLYLRWKSGSVWICH